MKFQSLLRSLSHRNFRLFFMGQGVSLIGTWMQQIAMSWLVFRMTGSSFWLGIIMFCGQIPALFLSPVAGVLIDRWNRHRLILLTQTLAMLQAFALAALDMSGQIAVWQIVPLALFLGLVNAFDMPARQTFLVEMVSRKDFSNAIALNSSMMNGARLIGPSLAGLLLASTSVATCFLINGISYLAVLAALLAMRLERPKPRHHKKLREGLQEGFTYVTGFLPIRVLLLTLCVASMAGSSYNVLLPEFAVHTLHGGARTLGWLSTAAGTGALTGAVFLASRSSVVGLGRWIWIGLALMGGGLVAFMTVPSLWLALLLLMVIGFGMMVQMAGSNTLLQTISDEDKRGRVMSFYTMAFLGMAPVGSLLTGYLASRLGLFAAFAINGVSCLLGALAFFLLLPRLRDIIRPIYVRLKLIPPLAAGLQAASELRLIAKE
ncbi:MAG: MFS transporter [Pseudomonadota bacterium]|nr:MFS transporter [Pseudomonadota bacterium]